MVKRGFVVSDLHLFSRRSRGEQVLSQLRPQLSTFDLFVFNGDTFDFAWSDCPSLGRLVGDSLRLIEDLLSTYPNCHFFYIFGNHDCLTAFVEGIAQLSMRYSNLSSFHEYLVLGDNLFLHGDVCNQSMDRAQLNSLRADCAQVKQRSSLARAVYPLLVLLGLNRVVYLTHPHTLMISRIHHYFDLSFPSVTKNIKQIFFGHTHAPFVRRDSSGIKFVNTGSAIRGLRSNFCEFQVMEN